MMTSKILLAFDFDHTMIEACSDRYVQKLAPGGKIPDHIESLYNRRCWIGYMRAIFTYLHQHGTMPEDILMSMTEV